MEADWTPHILYYVKKTCGESWKLDRARISFCDLTFVTRGEATYWIDDTPYTVRAGEAVFVPAGRTRQAGTRGMDCVAFNFVLPSDAVESLPPVLPFAGIRNIPLLLSEFHREWLFYGQLDSPKCRGIFLWLLSELEREPMRENRHVRKMKEYIADHMEEKLTATDVTAQTGLNPAYAGALFRRQEGCTILQYVYTLKIARAAQLLEDDSLHVGEVADMLGFEDIGYFSRMFKQITGQSPQPFRNTRRRSPLS